MNPYMEEALDLAARGWGRVSPNPAVGAVIVRDGAIVGRGFYTSRGVQHAEALALEEAGEKARGATMYVTLEPHSFHGRTPPCTDAILRAGIVKVVSPMEDPNPQVSGRGFEQLRSAGIEVEIDHASAARAEALNQAFLHFMRTGRPLVTLKAALTLDGKIAAPEDNEGWITSDRARAHVQKLRHGSDAILTGIGTVLADDCRRPTARVRSARVRCCASWSIRSSVCRSIPTWFARRRTMFWWRRPRPDRLIGGGNWSRKAFAWRRSETWTAV